MLEGDPKGDSQSILKHKINLQYPTLALPKSIFFAPLSGVSWRP